MAHTPIVAGMQPRARKTRRRLLSALERLLRTRDFEKISVADIAAEAGVSVGSVYAHFADKIAFLEALLDERIMVLHRRLNGEEPVPGVDDTASYPDLASALRAAVAGALAQARSDAHITRALTALRHHEREAATTGRTALLRQAHERTYAFFETYVDEITVASLPVAIRFTNWFLHTVVYQRAVDAPPSLPADLEPSDDELITAVSEMLYRWLTGPPSALPPPA